jgi:hypothetical protein
MAFHVTSMLFLFELLIFEQRGVIENRNHTYQISFEYEPFPIYSTISRNNRSMELSCLTQWENSLMSTCDMTGIVYEIDTERKQAYQRFVAPAGDGYNSLPLKVEWSTVGPNGELYLGSIGKEWVVNGVCTNNTWLTICRNQYTGCVSGLQ